MNQKSNVVSLFVLSVLFGGSLIAQAASQEAHRTVPIIYCTDLFHPAADPDDHFDLAAFFALDEFDVKAVILDGHIDRPGQSQFSGGGRVPLAQMMKIAGYEVPSAVGLDLRLTNVYDKAENYDPRYLAGVELMAKVLRESPVPVTIKISTGTDLVVLYNRYPELCKAKIKAVYFNAGHGRSGPSAEYNVVMDPVAYRRVFELGLPLYWAPCFGEGYEVGNGRCNLFWVPNQRAFLEKASPRLNRFISYALLRPDADPIAWLENGAAAEVPAKPRPMWSPPSLAHAAGRRLYQLGKDDFAWLRPEVAAEKGLKEYVAYEYQPVRVKVPAEGAKQGVLEVTDDAEHPTARIFTQKKKYPEYVAIMTSALRNLYGTFDTDSKAK